MDIFENDDFVVVNEETSLTVQVPTVSEGTEPETPLVPQAYSEELPSPEDESSLREFPLSGEENLLGELFSSRELLLPSEEGNFSRDSLDDSQEKTSDDSDELPCANVISQTDGTNADFTDGTTIFTDRITDFTDEIENTHESRSSILPFLTGVGLTLLAVKIYSNLNK